MTARIFLALMCLTVASCGKRSEQPSIDHELAQELYLACVSQPAASPYACRANAETLAERGAK